MEAGRVSNQVRPAAALRPTTLGRPALQVPTLTISTYAILLVLTVLFMGPFLFAFTTSFKSPSEIFLFPPRLIPEHWLWHNYVEAWTNAPFALFFTNTAIITLLAMTGQILSSCLVAYGFARFRFPGYDGGRHQRWRQPVDLGDVEDGEGAQQRDDAGGKIVLIRGGISIGNGCEMTQAPKDD